MSILDRVKQVVVGEVEAVEIRPSVPMLIPKDDLFVIKDSRGRFWLYRNAAWSHDGSPYIRQLGGPYPSKESALAIGDELKL